MTAQPPAIIQNLAESIGLTPMLDIGTTNKVQLLAKLEFANPTGSIKDRLARHVLDDHERRSGIPTENKRRTIVVPTNANLGISIATLAAKRHYKVISVVPERTSNDRILTLKALGAEIVRSPNEVRPEAPESAHSVATRLAEQWTDAVVVDETKIVDPSPYHKLAEEILQQTSACLDALFVAVESGAAISSVAGYLKQRIPGLKVFGVEPVGSVLGSHQPHGVHHADWKMEDIGSTSVPASLNKAVVDEWIQVSDKEAYSTARRLVRDQGVMCGPSSGAVVAAATRHAAGITQHTTHTYRSVVILNDTSRNYTSTLLSDDWLLENDLADDVVMRELEYLSHDRYRAASVEDLQLPAAVTIPPSAIVANALDLMLEREYSQLPVIHPANKKLVGYVSLSSLQARLEQGSVKLDDRIESCMYAFNKASGTRSKYKVITPDTSLAELAKFFEKNAFAVVTDTQRKWCLGVATKYDLISFLHRRQFL
ncbi:tryptophan synthase beta subunit-like PLP-dependent enzyme [Phycomyces nitens]|nr:tryptophan synthase beta subunit-like PLP-dependent enzyme [Phycomyces nitens]